MGTPRVSRRQAIGQWAAGAAVVGALTPVEALAAGAEGPAAPLPTGPSMNVRDFGATGDGRTKDTAAVQRAVDAATAAGGGVVLVPAGTFVCGTIRLKDRVTLHLAEGATILGSTDGADYANFPGTGTSRGPLALILAERARDVALVGRGRVNGRGDKFTVKDGAPGRPFGVKFVECTDVLIDGVRVEDAAAWCVHLLACERAVVRGLRVRSHANFNNDGLDIDACSDVAVSQCHFDCQDDAICLKSTPDRPCQNVTISDCFASSHCNLIKFGTSSVGGFRNVTIANCTLVAPRYSQKLNGQQRGIGGINIECVDGGVVDGVTVSNVAMDGVTLPLFVRLGDRGTTRKADPKPAGLLRNVVISNVVATNLGPTGASITGIPGHAVENVTLRDCTFAYEGGGTEADARRPIPELSTKYPEGTMFGPLPAWGLFCRHVSGLRLYGLTLRLGAPDARPAVAFDDVAEVDVDRLDVAPSAAGAPAVTMRNVRDATIRGCRPTLPGAAFVAVAGDKTAGIALLANDLRRAGKWLDRAADVSADAIAETGNLLPAPKAG